jgi:hypothetical protein
MMTAIGILLLTPRLPLLLLLQAQAHARAAIQDALQAEALLLHAQCQVIIAMQDTLLNATYQMLFHARCVIQRNATLLAEGI